MVQKVNIILEDDLTGGFAEQTVRFGLDGKFYEMDLSAENAAQLRDAIRPFVEKARRIQADKRSKTRRGTVSGRDGETAQIRAWAQENAYPVSGRGRVHQHIKDAYYAAHKNASDSN